MLPKIERKQAVAQSDDLELGIPTTPAPTAASTKKTFDSFVPERKLVYLVERNGVTWRHWLLMGCVTWLGWMTFFIIVGALAGPQAQVEISAPATYNVATFNGPIVVPLGKEIVTSDKNMHFFAVIGIPDDGTASNPLEDSADDDYSDYFSIPFFRTQQPESDTSDIKKLLTLEPGYHAEEGVYVTEPIAPGAGKDLLTAFDTDTAYATDSYHEEASSRLTALQTKLQEMMKQSQEGIVMDIAVSAANDTGSTGGASVTAEQSEIDPGLFASIPVIQVDPYYISPKDVKMNWFEALQACWGMGMQLVAIEDEAENQVILQLISSNLHPGDKVDFWTSGTNLWSKDRRRLFWATTGSELSYTSWHVNNPNEPDFQNCVQLTNNLDSPSDGSLRWNDYGCYEKNRFVCEAPSPASQQISAQVIPSTQPMEQAQFSKVFFEDFPQQLL